MINDLKSWMIGCIGLLITTLMAGNAFFIKRLVDRIDITNDMMWTLRQDVAIMKIAIDNLKHKKGE